MITSLATRTYAEITAFTALAIAALCLVGGLSISRAHAQLVAPISTARAPMLEIHVANNGLVLLRGAHVTRSEQGRIYVSISWGSSDFTWVALTDGTTRFFDSIGVPEHASDIRAGDTVTLTGMMLAGGETPALRAQYVRE